MKMTAVIIMQNSDGFPYKLEIYKACRSFGFYVRVKMMHSFKVYLGRK